MTTPIRPSLAHALNPQAAAPKPAAPQPASGFANALAAQRAFFQQVAAPKLTPATYTAAEVAKAAPAPAATQAPPAAETAQQLRRPGSYLNIVV